MKMEMEQDEERRAERERERGRSDLMKEVYQSLGGHHPFTHSPFQIHDGSGTKPCWQFRTFPNTPVALARPLPIFPARRPTGLCLPSSGLRTFLLSSILALPGRSRGLPASIVWTNHEGSRVANLITFPYSEYAVATPLYECRGSPSSSTSLGNAGGIRVKCLPSATRHQSIRSICSIPCLEYSPLGLAPVSNSHSCAMLRHLILAFFLVAKHLKAWSFLRAVLPFQ